ncbi:hypothetical protein ABZ464_50865 [Streptomyces sp. NPDC005820]|uniref:hypothetical protein n=1 Tax=Streptomyces sp. NPDC005820 TaxID=3157069 RepID=UPI0033E3B504
MDEDESIRRYGLHPVGTDLDEVRELLRGQTKRERHSQGTGDTELMKLCCVQLFNTGAIDDVLLIWPRTSQLAPQERVFWPQAAIFEAPRERVNWPRWL